MDEALQNDAILSTRFIFVIAGGGWTCLSLEIAFRMPTTLAGGDSSEWQISTLHTSCRDFLKTGIATMKGCYVLVDIILCISDCIIENMLITFLGIRSLKEPWNEPLLTAMTTLLKRCGCVASCFLAVFTNLRFQYATPLVCGRT